MCFFLRILLLVGLLFSYNSVEAGQTKRELVVVSLGSHCQASMIFRELGMRAYPGPLDQLISINHDGVARLINNKFEHMIDADYLIMRTPDCVVNTLYNLEFRHEWSSYDLLGLLPPIASFYGKRIQGFLDLPQIADRVVFFRTAFDARIYPYPENRFPTYTTSSLIITAEQAQVLYNSLKNIFPDLNFILAIVNYNNSASGINKNMEGIIEFKVDTLMGDYKKFVSLLGDPNYFDSCFQKQSNDPQ